MLWHRNSINSSISGQFKATAALCVATLLFAGCAQTGIGLTTGSIDKTAKAAPSASNLKHAKAAYQASPKSAKTALAYAKALRLAGNKKGSLAVLDAAAKHNPKHRAIAKTRGYLSLELGRPAAAVKLLRAALNRDKVDWRLHSALGSALASLGKQQQAQRQFARALAIKPNHPTILNNLALSYALDGNSATAEKMLRLAAKKAPGKSRLRQNLALLKSLRKTQQPRSRRIARSKAKTLRARKIANRPRKQRNAKNLSYVRRFNNPTGKSTIKNLVLKSRSTEAKQEIVAASIE